jgi:hypothetical protein
MVITVAMGIGNVGLRRLRKAEKVIFRSSM